METPGASNSGRQVATEDLSSGEKVYLRPNTDGDQYIRKFDDPANNFKPQREEEYEFYNRVLNSFCARFGNDPTNLQAVLLNVAIWCQFTSSCIWASSWLTKGSRRFQKDGDEQEHSKHTRFGTVCATTSEKILIDRKDAYNDQILQDWNTFRWYPAAKLTRMKVHVFSDSTLCV